VRSADEGAETVRSQLPMVITTDLRLNEPRYASLPNIMKAKKKKIDKISAEELGVSLERRLKTLKVIEPPPRQGGGKVDDVDGMIAKLKELGAI
jgi:electron transfer flavoprotein beta subunit